MLQKKRHPVLFTVNILIFAAIIIFQTSEIIDIGIKNAEPMLILPLLTAYSFFSDFKGALWAGLISGAFIDSVSQGAYCFNTAVLMLLSVLVYFMSNNLFNKNISSAIVLALLISALYYVLLWFFFYCIHTDLKGSAAFLLKYALPSAVYSAVFIFPFYFLYKYFKNLREH